MKWDTYPPFHKQFLLLPQTQQRSFLIQGLVINSHGLKYSLVQESAGGGIPRPQGDIS